jgi:3',5'-cyclic AMP phosphodiesterase CpdA
MVKRDVGGQLIGWLLLSLIACTGPSHVSTVPSPIRQPADLLAVADSQLRQPLVFIVYGDMRFTDTRETLASNPGPRQALVARVAAERPDAVFLTGDVPWHGGNADDYRQYAEETAAWRGRSLRVYPALGNHEFQQCAESECLENWWGTFPEMRGRRWYAVALGSRVRVLVLDSNVSLLAGSEQAQWLEREFEHLNHAVGFVLILMHHPPFTDAAEGSRANEQALAAYLASIARQTSPPRILVCAAHVHNYERFEHDGILYLVSGGGGAKPSAVTRSLDDRYQDQQFPNFHYLRFELNDDELRGEMYRLTDFDANSPASWAITDRFELRAPPGRK